MSELGERCNLPQPAHKRLGAKMTVLIDELVARASGQKVILGQIMWHVK